MPDPSFRTAGPAPDAQAREEKLLSELRQRLKDARERRGACPPWDELKADLLPGGRSRPGRDARLTHRADCPYCDAHVREWGRSLDHTSDALAAVEKGIARGLVSGAMKLAGRLGGKGERRESEDPVREADETSESAEPAESARIAAPAPPMPVRVPEPPQRPPVRAPEPPPRRAASDEELPEVPAPRTREPKPPAAPESTRLLVVEISSGVNAPESIFLCAEVLEASVALIADIEELDGDPDVSDVCGLVIVSHRDPADWPKLLRRARVLVPQRPIVIMSLFGQEPSPGARRALGPCLLAASDPAERLLLALDPDLR